MVQLGKYNAKEIEKKVQKYWDDNKTYKFNPKNKKPAYSIDTPPPYISGKMHIGHAFSYSQQDIVARFRRMYDGNVFYPFGTDDNGLPTERFVEKTKKVRSKSMSRAEFIDLCLATLKEITPTFIQDWKSIGMSADYELYYSTIDKKTQKVSQKSFIDLYKKNEIYNKEFPTLWCPDCQTTIAQAELEDKELPSLFSTLRFKCEGKDLLIATTRPELLPACVAVFVNPDDTRYTKLVGKKAVVPLSGQNVPIIADASAQIDKGTGVLMICSYGDKYDAEAINRHGLKPHIIISKYGTITDGRYNGLKIKEARKQILEDLKNEGFIAEQKQITHAVNVHDKCKTEIEFLPTEQWFIKLLDKKDKLIEQGKKVKWHPEFMFKRYENWVNGLEWDWSISRERHFGVPIPVWKCPKCKQVILPDEKELPVDPLQTKKQCAKCKCDAVGEEKVLDTWATSSLTPQIASNLVDNKIRIPFSLRPQAHDIIRTWAFYTITQAYLHSNEIPWKDIIVSGYVTMGGEKMSKSVGNVVEPKKIIDLYGTDALRYWAAGSKLGEDMDYQEKDIVTGGKIATKLWNASNLVLMFMDDYKHKELSENELEFMDRWLLSKLNVCIKNATDMNLNYEYSKARAETEQFFKTTFCDNYLEIVKDRLYNPDVRGAKAKTSAQYTLYTALLAILKLWAPILSHVTDEIYQAFYKEKEKLSSIHLSEWPKHDDKKIDQDIEKIGDIAINIISEARKFKSSNAMSLKDELSKAIIDIEKKQFDALNEAMDDLKATTKIKEISCAKVKSKQEGATIAIEIVK